MAGLYRFPDVQLAISDYTQAFCVRNLVSEGTQNVVSGSGGKHFGTVVRHLSKASAKRKVVVIYCNVVEQILIDACYESRNTQPSPFVKIVSRNFVCVVVLIKFES
jgi:hypothetical protein